MFSLSSARKVINGCVKDWVAVSNWNPSNGGLDYLQVSLSLSLSSILLRLIDCEFTNSVNNFSFSMTKIIFKCLLNDVHAEILVMKTNMLDQPCAWCCGILC